MSVNRNPLHPQALRVQDLFNHPYRQVVICDISTMTMEKITIQSVIRQNGVPRFVRCSAYKNGRHVVEERKLEAIGIGRPKFGWLGVRHVALDPYLCISGIPAELARASLRLSIAKIVGLLMAVDMTDRPDLRLDARSI